MTIVQKYRKLPVEISAIELTQYGDFVRAVTWINENGGNARFAEASQANGHRDHILIRTMEGLMEANVGWYIIRGVLGEFYPCDGSIFNLTYEAVEVPQSEVNLTGTGSHVWSRPEDSKSLVDGAAKALPN